MAILPTHGAGAPTPASAFVAILLILAVVAVPPVSGWALPAACAHTEHAQGTTQHPADVATGHHGSEGHATGGHGSEHPGGLPAEPGDATHGDLGPTLSNVGSSECQHCPPDQCVVNTACAAAAYGLTSPVPAAPDAPRIAVTHASVRASGPLQRSPLPTTPPPRIAA